MVRYTAAGIEGMVLKGLDSLYQGGVRGRLVKIRFLDTQEVIVGAVVGPIYQPTAVIAGRYRTATWSWLVEPRS